MEVGRVAERVDDLERRRLLALDAVRVDRVDDRDRRPLAQLAHECRGVVEVAADLQHRGAVDERLGQLAERDVALGDEHRARQAGPGRVGGGRRRRVAGERAHHRLGAFLDRLGDGQRHAPVLERAGGVDALELQVDVGADPLGQPRRRQQRRAPSSRVTTGVLGRHRQELAGTPR